MHLVGILFPHINDDARSKSHQTLENYVKCDHIWSARNRVYEDSAVCNWSCYRNVCTAADVTGSQKNGLLGRAVVLFDLLTGVSVCLCKYVRSQAGHLMLMQEQIALSDTCRAYPENLYTCSSSPLKVIAQRMRVEDTRVWVV